MESARSSPLHFRDRGDARRVCFAVAPVSDFQGALGRVKASFAVAHRSAALTRPVALPIRPQIPERRRRSAATIPCEAMPLRAQRPITVLWLDGYGLEPSRFGEAPGNDRRVRCCRHLRFVHTSSGYAHCGETSQRLASEPSDILKARRLVERFGSLGEPILEDGF